MHVSRSVGARNVFNGLSGKWIRNFGSSPLLRTANKNVSNLNGECMREKWPWAQFEFVGANYSLDQLVITHNHFSICDSPQAAKLILQPVSESVEVDMYEEIDERRAFTHYKAVAESGSSIGQLVVAESYMKGRGVEQDVQEGLRYLRLSAELGNAKAQALLCRCYLLGTEVTQDISQARYFAKLACQHGQPDGMCDLAAHYQAGVLVRQDSHAALWCSLFAAGRDPLHSPRGLGMAGECFCFGFGTRSNRLTAMDYHREAVHLGHIPSMVTLGRLHENETDGDVEKNRSAAVELYRRAASLGDRIATHALSRCYFAGIGVDTDKDHALKLYARAMSTKAC